MNNTIQVSELKDGQIAIITNWSPSHHIGEVVQNVNDSLIVIGRDIDESFPDVIHSKPTDTPKLTVRVLNPGTVFTLTEKGLEITSEPPKPLFIP